MFFFVDSLPNVEAELALLLVRSTLEMESEAEEFDWLRSGEEGEANQELPEGDSEGPTGDRQQEEPEGQGEVLGVPDPGSRPRLNRSRSLLDLCEQGVFESRLGFPKEQYAC